MNNTHKDYVEIPLYRHYQINWLNSSQMKHQFHVINIQAIFAHLMPIDFFFILSYLLFFLVANTFRIFQHWIITKKKEEKKNDLN